MRPLLVLQVAAADGECAAAPMRSLLAGLTLHTLTSAGVGAEQHVAELPATGELARVGVLRQALSLSLPGAELPAELLAPPILPPP